jgi:hypothetical protein
MSVGFLASCSFASENARAYYSVESGPDRMDYDWQEYWNYRSSLIKPPTKKKRQKDYQTIIKNVHESLKQFPDLGSIK